ncbi:MAG TPA: dihydrofolate reductase [Geopsychrobacteraceae bacterium]|jgi:dihydrofolate reductase
MRISLIVAMAANRVIGRTGQLPWHLPGDLARFKRLTMGYPLIMGRKTFESIGRALPGRRTIVLSRQADYRAAGCRVVNGLDEALKLVWDDDEVFICGGEELYRQALPLAQRIYLTELDRAVAGDSFFPEIPEHFLAIEEQQIEEEERYRFSILVRI